MIKKIMAALALGGLCASSLKAQPAQDKSYHELSVATNGIWDNWYVQAGLDMTLQNPYGVNFSEVFPKGKTFGIHAAVGKWFTPGLNLRMKMMWDNGIVGNGHLEWVAPFGRNSINHGDGGLAGIYGEAHLCLTNLILGYDESRRWDIAAYPRMGLVFNFSIGSATPVIGAGVINTYRINSKYSVYLDMAYNMTTSEYTDGATWSRGGVNGNANGYMDISLGVQINLGRSTFTRLAR